MTIERTHHAQNPVNVALLNYVAEVDQASYTELFAAFADLQTSVVKAHARFSKKMEYLCFTQQLCSRGRGHDRVFSLGPEAGKVGRSRGYSDRSQPRTKAAPAAEAAVLPAPSPEPEAYDKPLPEICSLPPYANLHQAQRVPAPSYNAMQAPVYVTPRASGALRPGALDYQRYASQGQRC